jgi:hypothetical protein
VHTCSFSISAKTSFYSLSLLRRNTLLSLYKNIYYFCILSRNHFEKCISFDVFNQGSSLFCGLSLPSKDVNKKMGLFHIRLHTLVFYNKCSFKGKVARDFFTILSYPGLGFHAWLTKLSNSLFQVTVTLTACSKANRTSRVLKGDVVYLSWPIAALVYEPKCGGGVSANENSCAHHVTWKPNKLWRSNSIFNLCLRQLLKSTAKMLFCTLYSIVWRVRKEAIGGSGPCGYWKIHNCPNLFADEALISLKI